MEPADDSRRDNLIISECMAAMVALAVGLLLLR